MKTKPVVVMSRCIEHGHCRYDGSQISSDFIKRLENYVEFILVCPETEIGLPTPREAIRIINQDGEERLVYSNSGTDVSDIMNDFTTDYLDGLAQKKVHGFILKTRSPSCGVRDVKIYKTIGKAPSMEGKTSGFFGKGVVEKFEDMPIEDEGRLRNYNIRDHFLTRIFTLDEYDKVFEKNTINALVEFHTKNKYLLMAYNQSNQKMLGNIAGNHDNLPVKVVLDEYYKLLKYNLRKQLRSGTNMNMLMHLFGYFKKSLSKEEKSYFLDTLEQYSMKKLPLSVPIAIIYAWVLRFNEKYLIQQTIFRPYPLEILDVTDSGKGID